MNQLQDFSKFTDNLQMFIENGKEEAKAIPGSLERMRFAAKRQGRKEDVELISRFLETVAREIAFFRKVGQIVSPQHKKTKADYFPWFQRAITPANFEKIEERLAPTRPFTCIEGFAIASEKTGGEVGSSSVRGPFFAAVAANYSEAIDLKKGTLVLLFSQAHKGDKAVELRIWNRESFAANLRGKKFDQASVMVLPDANETIVKLHKGDMAELFQIAAYTMVRASLSNAPPDRVAEEFMELVKSYGHIDTPQLAAPSA